MENTRAWVHELSNLPEPPLPPIFDSTRWSDDEGSRPGSIFSSSGIGPDDVSRSSTAAAAIAATQSADPTSVPPAGRLRFVYRDGEWRTERMLCLRNSLLAMVGFLEAANASDFAANVWNQWPAPMFAMVLMGIGGVVA